MMEEKKPRRTKEPQKKSDREAWLSWYKEEIAERILKGESSNKIKEDLGITSIERFLDEK